MRLSDLVHDLVFSPQAEKTVTEEKDDPPPRMVAHELWWTICALIEATQLNTFDPDVSIHNPFLGNLERKKIGLNKFTSLSLFCVDIERLLRDLFGDVESEALDRTVNAVLIHTVAFTRFACEDLWREHQDAWNWDETNGIGWPEGYGISGSQHRRGLKSLSDLQVRARKVLTNASDFSKYTVEFAKYVDENYVKPDEDVMPLDGDEFPF